MFPNFCSKTAVIGQLSVASWQFSVDMEDLQLTVGSLEFEVFKFRAGLNLANQAQNFDLLGLPILSLLFYEL